MSPFGSANFHGSGFSEFNLDGFISENAKHTYLELENDNFLGVTYGVELMFLGLREGNTAY